MFRSIAPISVFVPTTVRGIINIREPTAAIDALSAERETPQLSTQLSTQLDAVSQSANGSGLEPKCSSTSPLLSAGAETARDIPGGASALGAAAPNVSVPARDKRPCADAGDVDMVSLDIGERGEGSCCGTDFLPEGDGVASAWFPGAGASVGGAGSGAAPPFDGSPAFGCAPVFGGPLFGTAFAAGNVFCADIADGILIACGNRAFVAG